MKFALVNPNWDFTGSTYFGCKDPHVPLELLFAGDQIRNAGHEPLVVDAQTDNLTVEDARRRIAAFAPVDRGRLTRFKFLRPAASGGADRRTPIFSVVTY